MSALRADGLGRLVLRANVTISSEGERCIEGDGQPQMGYVSWVWTGRLLLLNNRKPCISAAVHVYTVIEYGSEVGINYYILMLNLLMVGSVLVV